MSGQTIAELQVGDTAELSRVVTERDIAEFARPWLPRSAGGGRVRVGPGTRCYIKSPPLIESSAPVM